MDQLLGTSDRSGKPATSLAETGAGNDAQSKTRPDCGQGAESEQEFQARVNQLVARIKSAAEQILQARGGVPVPEGVVVAEVGPDGTLRWLAGSPFPEHC